METLSQDLVGALRKADAALEAWWQSVNEHGDMKEALSRGPEEFARARTAAYAAAGPDPHPNVYLVLDQIADLYLSSPPLRNEIRVRGGMGRALLQGMYAYIGRNADLIRAGGGRESLRRALAVAAIEDMRTDFRDLYGYLVDLYLAAESTGLNPRADFVDVGATASRTPAYRLAGMLSTHDVLVEFESSAVFAEMRRAQAEGRDPLQADPSWR